MKTLRQLHDYVYQVRILVETDTNTLVHQLHSPTNDLPGALVTKRIVLKQQFDFDIKHIPGRMDGGHEGL
jgi:hypothetical protein